MLQTEMARTPTLYLQGEAGTHRALLPELQRQRFRRAGQKRVLPVLIGLALNQVAEIARMHKVLIMAINTLTLNFIMPKPVPFVKLQFKFYKEHSNVYLHNRSRRGN